MAANGLLSMRAADKWGRKQAMPAGPISARLTAERLSLAEDRVTDYKEKLEGKSPDEAHAQIAQLRQEVEALAAYGLSNEAQQRLRDALANASGDIRILRTAEASDADRLYRQTVTIFRAAGFKVHFYAIMGLQNPPDSGVMLAHWAESDQKLVSILRHALQVAGLDAKEVLDGYDWGDRNPTIVFTSRDPDWVAAARWG